VAQDLLIRLKKDLYIRAEDWDGLDTPGLFRIANRLQVPSYISLTSALSFHEVTTQVQPGYVESIAQKRTVQYEIKGIIFSYAKIQQDLYFGFQKVDGIFIASPEKALLDAMYMQSIGRYSIDMAALDLSKIREADWNRLTAAFPNYVKKKVEDLWKA
jgi:predicted transcriptional regulator of viral defense system